MSKNLDAIPIICVHIGDMKHLRWVIAQARESNPGSEFILLGNSSNAYYSGVKHYNVKAFSKAADRFAKIYKHTNTLQPEHRELFYHQRWLILAEFMEKMGIDEVFNIDSDILLFDDLSQMSSYYPGEMTLVKASVWENSDVGHEPHGGSTFVRNRSIISALSELMFEIYSDEKLFSEVLGNSHSGIGEMTILKEFLNRYPERVSNTVAPVNGYAMQDCMSEYPNSCSQYLTENGRCKLEWKNDRPYAFLKSDPKTPIEMGLLHMHGYCKSDMNRYMKLNGFSSRFNLFQNKIRYSILRGPLKYLNKYSAKLLSREPFPSLDPLSFWENR